MPYDPEYQKKWRETHKKQRREYSKKYRKEHHLINGLSKKEYDHQYFLSHRKRHYEQSKNWKNNHKEQRHKEYLEYYYRPEVKAKYEDYRHRLDVRERLKETSKIYRKIKEPHIKELRRKWYLLNKEKVKKYAMEHKIERKFTMIKNRKKRREIGNEIFWQPDIIVSNDEFHHISLEGGVIIPYKLHHFMYHNIWTRHGMAEMNALVFWYITHTKGIWQDDFTIMSVAQAQPLNRAATTVVQE